MPSNKQTIFVISTHSLCLESIELVFAATNKFTRLFKLFLIWILSARHKRNYFYVVCFNLSWDTSRITRCWGRVRRWWIEIEIVEKQAKVGIEIATRKLLFWKTDFSPPSSLPFGFGTIINLSAKLDIICHSWTKTISFQRTFDIHAYIDMIIESFPSYKVNLILERNSLKSWPIYSQFELICFSYAWTSFLLHLPKVASNRWKYQMR